MSGLRSRDEVLSRSISGIVGSNPAEDMYVCLMCLLRAVRRAHHSFRGVLPRVCVCVCPFVYDLETSTMMRFRQELGCCATGSEQL